MLKGTLFFFSFLAAYQGMWDVSSLTRDWTSAPCTGSAVSTTGPPGKSQEELFSATSWASFCFCFEGNGNSLQHPWLENSKDRGTLVGSSPWCRRVGHSRATCFLLSLLWRKHVKPNYEVGLISNMREPPFLYKGNAHFERALYIRFLSDISTPGIRRSVWLSTKKARPRNVMMHGLSQRESSSGNGTTATKGSTLWGQSSCLLGSGKSDSLSCFHSFIPTNTTELTELRGSVPTQVQRQKVVSKRYIPFNFPTSDILCLCKR